ncbi:MAG: ketoacyl-ACP synthase III [Candidatus Omnitrophica bacterium]|nr:ketoacyl-ACP synthase III [Candidatus Omnitrophota bacterium]
MTNNNKKVQASIVGLGYYVPPKVMTNFDIEKIVDTNDEWIMTRTGIKERRIAADDVASSDLGKEAALKAIKDAGLSAKDIDLIIVATISPDMIFPATACVLQKMIDAPQAACFDISAACSGFPYALTIAAQFIETGFYKNVLVVAAEALTHLIDWQDRSTCVLFGDGAGAAVVSRSRDGGGLLASSLGAAGQYVDLLKLPAGGSRMKATHQTVDDRLHYLKMAGNEVFKIAVRTMEKAAREVVEKAGISLHDVDCLIPHQANMRIIKAVYERLEIPKEKVFINVDRYGNMSGASTIVALCEAIEQGKVKKGSIVVIAAFGAGFTCGANVIRW